MLIRCAPALLVLFVLAPGTAQELAVDDIIAKHHEALGGVAKIKAIQSMKITGKMVVGGGQMEAPMTMQVKRPGMARMEMSFQGMSLIQAFDGSTAWMMNPFQGGTEPQKSGEEETAAARDDADLDGALMDYKSKGHSIELIGKEDVEGTAAYKLKITKKGGRVDYQYLDSKTFLALKTITRRKQMGQEFEIEVFPSNFKPVAGVLMPHAIEQKMGGRSMVQMTIEKAEPNVSIDDAVFKMPAKKEEKPATPPAAPATPPAGTGRIRAMLVDSSGAPDADKQVVLVEAEAFDLTGNRIPRLPAGGTYIMDSRGAKATSRTDSSGRFEFQGIPAGRYALQARQKEGDAEKPVSLQHQRGGRAVMFDLADGQVIEFGNVLPEPKR
jgi:outer membrane lipoprotein-sorting protein